MYQMETHLFLQGRIFCVLSEYFSALSGKESLVPLVVKNLSALSGKTKILVPLVVKRKS
jgi:hypothetical protein